MSVERLLQIHIAAMAVLGTVMLGVAQQSAAMSLLVLFAAVTSVCFTDALGWFRLHRAVVNLAAIAAMFFTLNDFLSNDSYGQLSSIAYLLICWQTVMLYQRKSPRVYWCLAVLSLLQVVVASVLNVGVQFGLVLILYLVVAFFALALFFVHRESLRFEYARRSEKNQPQQSPSRPAAALDVVLGSGPQAYPQIDAETIGRQLMGKGVISQTAAMGLVTLVFAIVFFYSAPRLGGSHWSRSGRQTRNQVGFTKQITLNEIGKVLQSDQLVMRVALYDERTRQPYPVFGEPYFQGTVLSRYSSHGGSSKWSQMERLGSMRDRRLPPADPELEELVRQEILIEPANQPTLFGVYPFHRLRGTAREIWFDPYAQELFRSRAGREIQPQKYRYVVGTTGFRNGAQVPITPHVTVIRSRPTYELTKEERRRLLQIDRAKFPTLIRTANEALEAVNVKDNRMLQARVLQNHFLNPDRYRYTLDFTKIDRQRKGELDPIEDFVANYRTGHCEYFASALCLMLRSQGIPARIVVGYVGGEFNSVGNYFQVRQRHAHAWVEAYLEAEQVPRGTLTVERTVRGGAWIRLDPTPGMGDTTQPQTGVLDLVDHVLDYAQVLWNAYVLDLSPERQRRSIYEPLTDKATGTLENVFSLRAWRQFGRAFRAALFSRGWPSWYSLLLLPLGAAGVWLLVRLARARPWRRWQRARPRRQTRKTMQVEFYRKLERLLAQLGLRRAPEQTQRELAMQAAQRLAECSANGVRELPVEIVEVFYRVRFGGSTLQPHETQAIDRALGQLENAVKSEGVRG